jgi:FkbM family methyltransferase
MKFVSFAQNFEDVMLWRALKHVQDGFYIDIGAWSPDLDSVTRAFYERGWRGVNIEPVPFYLQQLEARRSRDINLGLAVSDTDTNLTIHVISDSGLSSSDSQIIDMHKMAGWQSMPLEVPTRKLASVWNEYVPQGQRVHFLKVDVEGHEAAVLKSADWVNHRPWVVVVEATLPSSRIETHDVWEPTLTAAGYTLCYRDGLNRFYLAQEHEALAETFRYPPNVFDDFELHAQAESRADLAQQQRAAAQADTLTARASALAERIVWLEAALRQATDRVGQLEPQLAYLTGRTAWERLLFRSSGRPTKALRRALFHTNGKPRGIFRRWVLKPDGRPQKVFAMWMQSADYQALPRSVRGQMPWAVQPPPTPELHSLSPRSQYFHRRLEVQNAKDTGE